MNSTLSALGYSRILRSFSKASSIQDFCSRVLPDTSDHDTLPLQERPSSCDLKTSSSCRMKSIHPFSDPPPDGLTGRLREIGEDQHLSPDFQDDPGTSYGLVRRVQGVISVPTLFRESNYQMRTLSTTGTYGSITPSGDIGQIGNYHGLHLTIWKRG